jgi:murein DD-endopeptidase MepM/ murein hydrolase activator NlpD
VIRLFVALSLLWCVACSSAESQPSRSAEATARESEAQESIERRAGAVLDPSVPPPLASGTTASVPAPALGPLAAPPAPASLTLACAGAFAQGGTALCRTLPGARIVVDGDDRGAADAQGWAVIGFDRDSPRESLVEARANGATAQQRYAILARAFSVQRIDGLPPQTVTPTDPDIVARIARERARKNEGFASRADVEGWLEGFVWPVEGTISGSWGNQRILNGEPRQPHYGVDIAMPEGTPIRAPAAGVIALAEPDFYLEGGLVLIDHGQGLITMYLHLSRLDVRQGDRVEQGQVVGAVGKKGRATGAHLCWRMRWRDRNLDPALAILGLAEARNALGRSQ